MQSHDVERSTSATVAAKASGLAWATLEAAITVANAKAAMAVLRDAEVPAALEVDPGEDAVVQVDAVEAAQVSN
eukprot:CAMPEP_0183380692 /NCGR_PEP_ID=MMETSP0164_2-20130417/126062_1 /TAXON_ID=221442 /ORGANISM="Coccolithus pelagicus ssp braarudi, Strain PLY182g" /LENGTH=73 /DNA_ID=CAMNT_0025558293 /DNA_START=752 /DNA_END=971 /DNA_ORIENTATION=-